MRSQTSNTPDSLREQISKQLFDFAKYVRLASMQANEKITAMYQMDDNATVDVDRLLQSEVHHIMQLIEADKAAAIQVALQAVMDAGQNPVSTVSEETFGRRVYKYLAATLRGKE